MNEPLFTPPRPIRPPGKASLVQVLRMTLGNVLTLFHQSAFSVDVGRFSVPTLPWLKRRWVFSVREPELVREVLVRRPDTLPKSGVMSSMLRDVTGDSLFVSRGEVWRRQRRLVDPAFEQAGLRAAFPMMREACDEALTRLADHAANHPKTPLNVDEAMTHFAADVIFRTIYSEPIGVDDARRIFAAFEAFQKVSFAQGMLGLANVPPWLVPGAGRARRSARVIREILKAPLERRLAAMRAGASCPSTDILGVLLRTVDPVTGTKLSDDELLDQIAMLFLAGHETSASGLAWTLYLLANDPGTQTRVYEEALAVRAGKQPEFSHMKRLAFTRDVFRESLRLYPPVAFFARDATEPMCLGERQVAAGSMVVVAPWVLHRHANHWARPDVFDPDRFATPEGAEGLRCAYLPFSLGERVCIGAAFALQEATLFLTQAIERFCFAPEPGHTPQPTAYLTLRSSNGVRLRIAERPARSS